MANWTSNWMPGSVLHYRKRVIDVEAFRYGRETEPEWFTNLKTGGIVEVLSGERLLIHTPTGDAYVWPGDWVVRGPRTPQGREDVYPVHHDQFSVLFEPTPEYAKLITS